MHAAKKPGLERGSGALKEASNSQVQGALAQVAARKGGHALAHPPADVRDDGLVHAGQRGEHGCRQASRQAGGRYEDTHDIETKVTILARKKSWLQLASQHALSERERSETIRLLHTAAQPRTVDGVEVGEQRGLVALAHARHVEEGVAQVAAASNAENKGMDNGTND